jgi:hypothetical protein
VFQGQVSMGRSTGWQTVRQLGTQHDLLSWWLSHYWDRALSQSPPYVVVCVSGFGGEDNGVLYSDIMSQTNTLWCLGVRRHVLPHHGQLIQVVKKVMSVVLSDPSLSYMPCMPSVHLQTLICICSPNTFNPM